MIYFFGSIFVIFSVVIIYFFVQIIKERYRQKLDSIYFDGFIDGAERALRGDFKKIQKKD